MSAPREILGDCLCDTSMFACLDFYVVYLVPVGLDCVSYVAKTRVDTKGSFFDFAVVRKTGIMASKNKHQRSLNT